MIVYHYDPATGAYQGIASDADEDPMESGRYLIPANATDIIPPSPPDPTKQWAVFHDGSWFVEDIPIPPAIYTNIQNAPIDGMWPKVSVKEALKGGI